MRHTLFFRTPASRVLLLTLGLGTAAAWAGCGMTSEEPDRLALIPLTVGSEWTYAVEADDPTYTSAGWEARVALTEAVDVGGESYVQAEGGRINYQPERYAETGSAFVVWPDDGPRLLFYYPEADVDTFLVESGERFDEVVLLNDRGRAVM